MNVPENCLQFRRTDETSILAVFHADTGYHYLGDDWRTMDLQLQDETYRRHLRSGIPFSTTIPHRGPGQVLKIVVYDVQNDKAGARLYRNPW